MKRISALLISALFLMPSGALAGDGEYKQFRLENVSCDAAVSYKAAGDGLEVAVSAIAYGKGAEFRKWSITDIRLRIDSVVVRPEKSNRFFVRKESIFRYPAAIVFAALGTQVSVPGSALASGITKAGMAVGLGLLVIQAKGDITGEVSVFNLDWDMVDRIYEGRDVVEITVENEYLHKKDVLKIDLIKAPLKEPRFDYKAMRQDELMQVIDTLEGQVLKIRKNQERYKFGVDSEYLEMQNKIEELEVERAAAYKAWYDRRNS